MYSVGLTPDRDEEKSELFGNLSLVGSGGRFVAVLTKRQLTLERFDGHGIRLSLASISRMRHMKVPLFPSGTVPLGLLAIYLGTSVLMPPYAMVAMAGGSLPLLGYVLSRTSVLAVETEAGDRHIISGSEGVLLRLCLMVDRVRHGSTIEEARMGLEHIDAELPAYPAFTDAGGGLPEPKGLLELPEEESFLTTVPEPESHFTGFSAPTPLLPRRLLRSRFSHGSPRLLRILSRRTSHHLYLRRRPVRLTRGHGAGRRLPSGMRRNPPVAG